MYVSSSRVSLMKRFLPVSRILSHQTSRTLQRANLGLNTSGSYGTKLLLLDSSSISHASSGQDLQTCVENKAFVPPKGEWDSQM